jgi:ATP/maltotriose-dependent transcriptional regulator MalT
MDAHPGNRPVLLLREGPDTAAVTPREWDVMQCVAAGMSNAETAPFLWVSSATVRKHLENTYAKLGVRSRTAALAKLGPALLGIAN